MHVSARTAFCHVKPGHYTDVKDPLNGVFIVSSCEDLLDNKFPRARDNSGSVSEVGVLEKNTVVLLVDTYRVLDRPNIPSTRGEIGMEIMNCPLAITAKRQAISHITAAILSEVEGVFSLVWHIRVTTEITCQLQNCTYFELLSTYYGTTISARDNL
jgi:hypothetical protein